jgi:S1-C subfamily serine protease
VKLGDAPIAGVDDVFTAVRGNKVGDTVTVEFVRGDTRRTADVVMGSDADRP